MNTIMKDLTEGMQRLCAVANRVVAADGKVSALERDLLLEDLRHLYDVTLKINVQDEGATVPAEQEPVADTDIISSAMMATMAAMSVPEPEPAAEPEPEPEPVAEHIPEPEPVAEPEPEPVAAVEPAAEPEPMPAMEEIESNGNSLLFDEIVIEEEPAAETEPEPVAEPEPIIEPMPEPEPVKQQASLLDYLKRQHEEQPAQRTLGESLGVATASTAGAHKVDDLRTVININDKFSFMSELFKNNMRAYNDFIMQLNDMTDRDEAMAHVAEVAKQYQWDEGSNAVQTFYKIFDKKF